MKEDVIVVDEFLSKSYFNELSYLVSSDVFPWSYNKEISNTNNDNRLGSYGFQFHMIMHGNYRQCRELDISLGCLKTIQDYIGANSIFKARYDMTLYNPEKFLHSPHIDGDEIPNYVSAILYMNDSDGDTLIYNEKCMRISDMDYDKEYTIKKSITPRANRLVLFKGNLVHTGHSPSENKSRVLLNVVFDMD